MKKFLYILIPAILLLISLNNPAFSQNGTLEYTLHEGELEGAPFKVAVPDGWESGNLFFHVHGWRPADAPHEADLDLEDPFYQELINNDWAIARTAFYENGVDNEAHIRALWDLREWIDTEISELYRVLMEGESTAGSLVLRIAELEPNLADGVIAKGAFVDLEDETADSFLRRTPQIPAILMSNLTELDGPISYAAVAENAEAAPALRPLRRPGHVNVNWVEKLAAFEALNSRLDSGEFNQIADGTRTVPDRETGTTIVDEMPVNRVTDIDPYFGNATLGYHPRELADFGIHQGEYFVIEIDGQQRDIFYGNSYGDVREGEWVAFPTADDQILIARNHQSAVQTAGLQTGDEVKIIPIQ